MMAKKKPKNPDSRLESSLAGSVGDDLTEEQLDDLWDAVVLGERRGTYMAQWWDDKPHQILHRLLARLTRAENKRRRRR